MRNERLITEDSSAGVLARAALSRRFWLGPGYLRISGFDAISRDDVAVSRLRGKFELFENAAIKDTPPLVAEANFRNPSEIPETIVVRMDSMPAARRETAA
jgi:hypothetical protein